MTLYVSNRDGNGKTDEKGHYKFPSLAFTGGVVLPGLAVTQNSPLAMSVVVSEGDFRIETSLDYAYTGWSSSPTVLSINTADAANPRIDTVVVYVDKTEPTSPIPPNNPGITKFMVIPGLPSAIPAAPSGTTIQDAIGANNPYILLADVRVNAGATSITNSNITDLRTRVTIADNFVSTSSIIDGSVTYDKLANNSVGTNNLVDNSITVNKLNLSGLDTQKVLWSGAWYMNAAQTATLSENITDQVNGIVIVLSQYSGGPVNDYFISYYIPKILISAHDGNFHTITGLGQSSFAWKFLRVYNNRIEGHDVNDDADKTYAGATVGANKWVMRYVYGV